VALLPLAALPQVLPALLAGEGGAGGGSVRALVESKGLIQISDPAALAAIVDAVLEANPKQLQQYREGARRWQAEVGWLCACRAVTGGMLRTRLSQVPARNLPSSAPLPPPSPTLLAAGKTKLQGFFVGAVMKESKGRANPAELNRILMERLNAPPS